MSINLADDMTHNNISNISNIKSLIFQCNDETLEFEMEQEIDTKGTLE